MHVHKRHARFDSVGRDARVAKTRAGLIAKGRNRYALARYVQRRFHTPYDSLLGVQSCERSLGPARNIRHATLMNAKHSLRHISRCATAQAASAGTDIRHIASAGAAFATLRLTINSVRATPPNDAFARTPANETHRMGQRRLFSYPFYPFAPTAPLPDFLFFVTLAFFGA